MPQMDILHSNSKLIMWYNVEVPLMVSEYKEILFIAISSFHMFKCVI